MDAFSNKENYPCARNNEFKSPLVSVEDIMKKINTSLSSASLDDKSSHLRRSHAEMAQSAFRQNSRCETEKSGHQQTINSTQNSNRDEEYLGRHSHTRNKEIRSTSGNDAQSYNQRSLVGRYNEQNLYPIRSEERYFRDSNELSGVKSGHRLGNYQTDGDPSYRSRSQERDAQKLDHEQHSYHSQQRSIHHSSGNRSRHSGTSAARQHMSGGAPHNNGDDIRLPSNEATDRILPVKDRSGSNILGNVATFNTGNSSVQKDVSLSRETQKLSDDAKQSATLRVMTSPLNARRLRPTRQRTKNAMVS